MAGVWSRWAATGWFLAAAASVVASGPALAYQGPNVWIPSRASAAAVVPQARLAATVDGEEDCGCPVDYDGLLAGPVVTRTTTSFAGDPSSLARTLDARRAVSSHRLYDARSSSVPLDDLIGRPEDDRTSIVVFLRSLG